MNYTSEELAKQINGHDMAFYTMMYVNHPIVIMPVRDIELEWDTVFPEMSDHDRLMLDNAELVKFKYPLPFIGCIESINELFISYFNTKRSETELKVLSALCVSGYSGEHANVEEFYHTILTLAKLQQYTTYFYFVDVGAVCSSGRGPYDTTCWYEPKRHVYRCDIATGERVDIGTISEFSQLKDILQMDILHRGCTDIDHEPSIKLKDITIARLADTRLSNITFYSYQWDNVFKPAIQKYGADFLSHITGNVKEGFKLKD